MTVSVGSMMVLLGEGESMAAWGGHARRREEGRAGDGSTAWEMRSGAWLGAPEAVGEREIVAVGNGDASATWGYLAVRVAPHASVAIPMMLPGSGRYTAAQNRDAAATAQVRLPCRQS